MKIKVLGYKLVLILSILFIVFTISCKKDNINILCEFDHVCTTSNSTLDANQILQLFVNKDGMVHFKTLAQSNFTYNLESKKITRLYGLENLSTISGGHVSDEDNGKIVFSTFGDFNANSGGGVVIKEGTDFTVFDQSNSPFPSHWVSVAKYFNSELWVGFYKNWPHEGGLYVYDGINWRTFDPSDFHQFGARHPSVSDIEMDSEGMIWVTSNLGLHRISSNSITNFNMSNSNLQDNNLGDLSIDSDNTLYIASSSGLITYKNNTFHLYNTSNSNIPSNLVSSIAVTDENIVYVGTTEWLVSTRPDIYEGGGVGILKNDTFQIIDTENSSLPINKVYSIALGKSNEVYCGTSKGLYIKCLKE